MKKILCLFMCVFLVIGLSACGGDISKVKTHDVDSEIYSADDINSAVDTIEKEFDANWNGCTLTEIYYAGDDYAPIFRNLPTGTMQMKLLCCYLHLMLIHQAATDY